MTIIRISGMHSDHHRFLWNQIPDLRCPSIQECKLLTIVNISYEIQYDTLEFMSWLYSIHWDNIWYLGTCKYTFHLLGLSVKLSGQECFMLRLRFYCSKWFCNAHVKVYYSILQISVKFLTCFEQHPAFTIPSCQNVRVAQNRIHCLGCLQ